MWREEDKRKQIKEINEKLNGLVHRVRQEDGRTLSPSNGHDV